MSANVQEGVKLWRAFLNAEADSEEERQASKDLDKWADGATAEEFAEAYDAA